MSPIGPDSTSFWLSPPLSQINQPLTLSLNIIIKKKNSFIQSFKKLQFLALTSFYSQDGCNLVFDHVNGTLLVGQSTILVQFEVSSLINRWIAMTWHLNDDGDARSVHLFIILFSLSFSNSYSTVDPHSFKDQLWFWINNIQLRVPNSVVLLVGTHCDQCIDQEEVMEKKKDIEEKVKAMLAHRRMVLKQQRHNLEENMDLSLFIDQADELDCLLEYNLKVLIGCNKLPLTLFFDFLQACLKKLVCQWNSVWAHTRFFRIFYLNKSMMKRP